MSQKDIRKTKFNIYIPSKDRPTTCYTAKILKEFNINFFLVIEPQDEKKYLQYYSKKELIVLDKNNAGQAYVRNYCIEYSIKNNEKFHWQVDDNIKSFRIRENNKNIKKDPFEIFTRVENYLLKHENIIIGSLRHIMFAFSQTKDLSFNQCMNSCFLIKNNLNCRFKHNTIEDIDFSLKALMTGGCTVIFNKFLMEKVTTGMKGGNTEISNSGNGRIIRAKELCKDWPHGFKIIIKNNIPRLRPLRVWSRFKVVPVLKGK